VAPGPQLDKLANTIRERHKKVCAAYRKACAAYRTAVDDALEAGRALIEAKDKLGCGPFGRWIVQNCGFSQRTAQVYMQVAEGVAGGRFDLEAAKAQSSAGLSINSILKKLAKPRPKKAETVTEPETAHVPTAAAPADPESACAPADRQQREQLDEQDDSDDGDEPLTWELVDPAAEPNEAQPAGLAGSPERCNATRKIGRLDSTAGAIKAEPAGESGSSPAATSDTADAVGDAEWLESMPIRLQLRDPAEFDAQALIWKRVQPAIDMMRQVFSPSGDDLSRAWNSGRYRERVAYVVAGPIGLNSPERWRLCARCRGTGRSNALGMECVLCGGAGFAITHEGAPAVSE
jgi:hypothetical protein